MLDYTALLKKLAPDIDGESNVRLRAGIVAAVNSDGTLDITMSSGVTIPDVPRLAGAYIAVGAVVQILVLRGSMLVLGPTATGAFGFTERVNTNVLTSDSSTFTTTETEVQTVTAPLVSGQIYKVTFETRANSSASTDNVLIRLREDNVSGTELHSFTHQVTSTVTGGPVHIEAEYTAVSTGNKTFSGTMSRASGTGTCFREAATTRPSYMYVDHVRG